MKRTELKRKTPLQAKTRSLQNFAILQTRTPLQTRIGLKASSGLKTYKPLKAGKPGLRRTAHSTEPPTAADLERWTVMRKIGCVACLLNKAHGLRKVLGMAIEIHHQLSGGRRIGHHAAVALCVFHHQGTKWPEITMGYTAVALIYGPSLARESRAFAVAYGDDAGLLEFQGALLRQALRTQVAPA